MAGRRRNGWSRLDNAAKIFPSTTSSQDTKVFRFACELYEPVEPQVLQRALDRTMESFPLYRSVLRRGFFWYYFEESALTPQVQEESRPPCGPLYDRDRKRLLFEVTYYQCRINLEVYHALSDGTGALQFLRTLVLHYLTLKNPDRYRVVPQLDYDASLSEKMDDSFRKYYGTAGSSKTPKLPRACRITGERRPQRGIKVIEGIVSVKSLLEKAHAYGATVTVFLASVFLCAIRDEMTLEQLRRPVVLAVPVNLRNYFSSESARNFFGVIEVGYNFSKGPGDIRDVLESVAAAFKRELRAQRLSARMNELSALEHNYFISAVPLAVKDVVLQVANWMNERVETAALSNVGKVVMPPEVQDEIRLFDVFTSTRRIQLCMCSYQDRLVLSFASPFESADIEKRFFRTLTGVGVQVELVSSQAEDGARTVPVTQNVMEMRDVVKKRRMNKKRGVPEA